MFMNVLNGVTSPREFSHRYVLQNFFTVPVAFKFSLTYGLIPQLGDIKFLIVTVYGRSIFQVGWPIATLIKQPKQFIFLCGRSVSILKSS